MHINYYQKLEFKRKLHTFNMNPYTNILTVLAVTCKDSIVNYSKLIQLVITNFELNFKEPTHSAKQSFFFFFEFLLIIQNPNIGKNKIQKKINPIIGWHIKGKGYRPKSLFSHNKVNHRQISKTKKLNEIGS